METEWRMVWKTLMEVGDGEVLMVLIGRVETEENQTED